MTDISIMNRKENFLDLGLLRRFGQKEAKHTEKLNQRYNFRIVHGKNEMGLYCTSNILRHDERIRNLWMVSPDVHARRDDAIAFCKMHLDALEDCKMHSCCKICHFRHLLYSVILVNCR